ncbi:MAG: stage II sporulation protein M [Oscillospiraceae bacterium]|jgi:hypothetical protein|nr:stage II sporulation protein M [Oscillospiraceae bacterium]
MKIKRRFNVVRLNKMDFINKYNIMIILTVLFVCGIIIGVSIIKNDNAAMQSSIAQIFTKFYTSRSSQSMLSTFAHSMLINMIFLGGSFTFGMCCIGVPAVCALPFIRGISLGVITGYMYHTYALDGVGHFMLTMLPGAVFSVSLLLISCNESYKTAMDLLRMVTKGTVVQNGIIKRYLTVYLFLIGFTALASLLDMVLVKVFSGLFALG